jgi:methionyl-tRNA formyltransferase
MDEGLDTGPIYIRSALSILEDDSSATLHDKLAEEGAGLVTRHLDDIVAGRLVAVPQDESQATYAPMIKKTDGEIDWQNDVNQLGRQIRAMTPWPGAYTNWEGKRLKILSARAIEIDGQRHRMPGEVFLFKDSIVVAAKAGGLLLIMVQLAGKPPMSVNDFVRGRSDFVGSHLGG